MSLDKAIAHGKEKRKPYRGSKAIDYTCRNHGSCQWCIENRTHKFRDKESDTVRVETKYFAFDETEFDIEAECLAYEKKLEGLWDGVVLLDEEFHTPNGIPSLEFAEGFAIYVKVLDAEKAGALFNWLYEYAGVSMPPVDMIYKGGIFKYDENAPEDWVDLTERLREAALEIDSIEKAVNSVG